MTTWLNLMAVAVGGALGSVARYLVTTAAAWLPGGSSMLGTTTVNVIGCAALGAFVEFSLGEESVPERVRLAVQVGFLGGLTTFSTFAGESTLLAASGRWLPSAIYVLANLMLGWIALVASASVVKSWMA